VEITPSDVIETIIDELALGELGRSVDAFALTRTSPGGLLLDYGPAGRLVLTVRPAT
jgi:hypothetical protein